MYILPISLTALLSKLKIIKVLKTLKCLMIFNYGKVEFFCFFFLNKKVSSYLLLTPKFSNTYMPVRLRINIRNLAQHRLVQVDNLKTHNILEINISRFLI